LRIHHLTVAAIVALVFPWAGAWQTSESAVTLQQTRDRLLADLARLPRYTCVQSITRKYFGAPIHVRQPSCSELIAARDARNHELSLESWDRLRFEVAIVEHDNVYSWVGAPRFEQGNLETLSGQGPLGNGDFGPFLSQIFTRAIVIFQKEETVDGRRLLKYSYDMPVGRSGYKVKTDEGWAATAYSGTFLLDPVSADITALTVRTAELPPAGPACFATSEVDYGRTPIHDRLILIPRETRLRTIRRDGSETLSATTFSSCREYASKSRMLLHAPPGSSQTSPEVRPAAIRPLPEGLHLETRIVTLIDSDTAWAGDAIEAVLRSPVRDKKHNIVVPAGAPVHGRLVRVGHASEPFDHFEIGIELESLEINGQSVPLRAARYYSPSATTAIIISRSPASAPDARSAGIGIFSFRGDHVRLKTLDTNWVTRAPSGEATPRGDKPEARP
jgi:hypothetical protein